MYYAAVLSDYKLSEDELTFPVCWKQEVCDQNKSELHNG